MLHYINLQLIKKKKINKATNVMIRKSQDFLISVVYLTDFKKLIISYNGRKWEMAIITPYCNCEL